MRGRTKALLALGLLLVPGLVLGSFVLGVGSPSQAGPPTGSYGVEYTGRALVVTQESGRVRSGTLWVTYGGNGSQIWVAPNGSGYDNGGTGHPVEPGDQFVFVADVEEGDPVAVRWTDGETRVVLAEATVGPPKTPSARLQGRRAQAVLGA